MTELDFWIARFDGASAVFTILGLIILNIIILWFAITQKVRRYKLERDILAAKTFSNTSLLRVRQPFTETAPFKGEIRDDALDNGPRLKIDQAIKMLKNGATMEEVKTVLEIEASYLRIIATHHLK